jgi:hypothetical protein
MGVSVSVGVTTQQISMLIQTVPVGFRSMHARVEATLNVIRGTLWLVS